MRLSALAKYFPSTVWSCMWLAAFTASRSAGVRVFHTFLSPLSCAGPKRSPWSSLHSPARIFSGAAAPSAMAPTSRMTPAEKRIAHSMHFEQGLSRTEVAKLLKRSLSSVSRLFAQKQAPRPIGRPRALTSKKLVELLSSCFVSAFLGVFCYLARVPPIASAGSPPWAAWLRSSVAHLPQGRTWEEPNPMAHWRAWWDAFNDGWTPWG